MKTYSLILLCIFFSHLSTAQDEVIQLYDGATPGSENWNWNEAEYTNEADNFRVIYNVSKPTLTVFKPDNPNGTAIIICPGGAFQFLAIDSEGYEVAKHLNEYGITAFVLKYRLSHSLTDNPLQELSEKQPGSDQFNKEIEPIVSFAIEDGKMAIAHVRDNAEVYKVNSNRIGIMGFSAGGTVTSGVSYLYDENSKPNFVAPIYPYVGSFDIPQVPEDAPPMFICAATDDGFGFEEHCMKLYNDWNNANKSVEMHLYAKGGHGFGMNEKDLPVDTWIDRFTDWLNMMGYLEK